MGRRNSPEGTGERESSALHSENLASQTYKYANNATMLNIAWTGKKLAR
jgi:hypothetical protein